MLSSTLRRVGWKGLTHHSSYFLLEHKKMEATKKKLYSEQQQSWKLRLKFLLKQAKYTIVQGTRDLWEDTQWIIKLYRKKQAQYFTGFQLFLSRRIKIDLLKFVPYSLLLIIPFAEFGLPIILWLFPNAVPSHYLFDTAQDRKIEKCERMQEESHQFLLQKLISIMSKKLALQPQDFSNQQFFKEGYFKIIDELEKHLNFLQFSSDQLIQVLEFMGEGEVVTGTSSINKIANLFTLHIPRLIYKVIRWLISKITKKDLKDYEDPWFIRGNFRLARFNYFPFEGIKRRFLIWQINRKFRRLWHEDRAFQIYGLEDVSGKYIKDIARERGLVALSCYQTLRNVVKNDWVKFTTHPKFKNNNVKLWYSVMMYTFLKESSREMN